MGRRVEPPPAERQAQADALARRRSSLRRQLLSSVPYELLEPALLQAGKGKPYPRSLEVQIGIYERAAGALGLDLEAASCGIEAGA
jgi:hypothetical protein